MRQKKINKYINKQEKQKHRAGKTYLGLVDTLSFNYESQENCKNMKTCKHTNTSSKQHVFQLWRRKPLTNNDSIFFFFYITNSQKLYRKCTHPFTREQKMRPREYNEEDKIRLAELVYAVVFFCIVGE